MRVQEIDYTLDLKQSILWQYNEASNLLSLIDRKQAWYDLNQSAFWSSWYTDVFNLMTANTFGLSVWSYILNVPFYVPFVPESPTKPIWGFNQIVGAWPTLLNSYFNFGNSNFSTKGKVTELTLEEQRFLLRLRYFQLTTRGDITDINVFLNYLCSTSDIGYSGTIYVLDGLDMTITYVFTAGNIDPELLTVIKALDLLPRPAGVGIKYVINTGTLWGFGPYNQNFGHGNFIQEVT